MHNEQVFTPRKIVELILDMIGYYGCGLRRKHIMDNSCGDGNFLVAAAERYIQQCVDDGVDKETAANELSEFVCGIEIDVELVRKTVERLDALAEENDLPKVTWKVYCADSLDEDVIRKFEGKMHYVVGNPPYCNVHDFSDDVRQKVLSSRFADGGMTDLYIAFFDIGLRMLDDWGKMVYITPNSWLTSVAGRSFRRYVTQTTHCLDTIVQCGHEKVFKDATTFTAITRLDKWKKDNGLEWWTLGEALSDKTEGHKCTYNDCKVKGCIYLGDADELDTVRNTLTYDGPAYVTVKNGFATLEDKMFMPKDQSLLPTVDPNVIDVVKANTGERRRALFPYDADGKEVDFLGLSEPLVKYLTEYSRENGRTDKPFVYGRAQGINDVGKTQYAFNSILRSANDIRVTVAEPGCGVYGGLYIVCADGVDVLPLLSSKGFKQGFLRYIKTLGKYKNGGYFTFSSKDLENYINNAYDEHIKGKTAGAESQI